MRLFECQNCRQVLFFDNRTCVRCGSQLGFIPSARELSALSPAGSDWVALARPAETYRFCANAERSVCNWLISSESSERFCVACRHNRTVPDFSIPMNFLAWAKMELAKHRLFYTLLQLGLPTPNRVDRPRTGLVFDFLADGDGPNGGRVMTGHEDGLITLAVAEANDAEREARRAQMGEPYRTLLGHFRHEVGHFYWDMLIRDGHRIAEFRAIFGDETADYGESLKRHYASGAPPDWQDNFVSAYAASHPWEDWAETWAHYLHILDGVETAAAFRLQVDPQVDSDHVMHTKAEMDAFGDVSIVSLVHHWLPLTVALNAMNQSMGLNDLYPFVLSEQVIKKLGFIHKIVHDGASSGSHKAPMADDTASI